MSAINITFGDSLQQLKYLNGIEAQRRWPVILFISILMIFGAIGNLNVFYIYTFRYKRSTYRLFVVSLAVIDLVACFISMPFEIADELHPYDYFDQGSCKVFRFINVCVGMTCALMLVLIASERYRKICTPYAAQMSESSAKHLTLAVTCITVILTSPSLYIYGRKTVQIPGLAINGSKCTWGDHTEGSVFGYVFYGYSSLIIVVCMISLSILYSLIGCHIKTHAHNMRRTMKKYVINSGRNSNNKELTLMTPGNFTPNTERKEHKIRGSTETLEEMLDKTKLEEKNNNPNCNEPPPNSAIEENKDEVRDKKNGNSTPCRRLSQVSTASSTNANVIVKEVTSEKEARITKVLFTITLLFIFSYLPYIIILVVYGINSNYEADLSTAVHNLYLIGLRLYMINNAANWILYNFFDMKFRSITKEIYSGVFYRLKAFFIQRKK